jgi:hypothetical protein
MTIKHSHTLDGAPASLCRSDRRTPSAVQPRNEARSTVTEM